MHEIIDNESVWCQIDFCGLSALVGVVYRPPSSPESFLENIQSYMQQKYKPNQKVILAGDFNLPSIDWHALHLGSTDVANCNLLLELMLNFNLVQLVKEATRVAQSTESVLDLLCVGNFTDNTKVSVYDGISVTS